MRIDEFSRNTLREKHGEFQDVASICSGKFHTFPVNRQLFQVFEECLAATSLRSSETAKPLLLSDPVAIVRFSIAHGQNQWKSSERMEK